MMEDYKTSHCQNSMWRHIESAHWRWVCCWLGYHIVISMERHHRQVKLATMWVKTTKSLLISSNSPQWSQNISVFSMHTWGKDLNFIVSSSSTSWSQDFSSVQYAHLRKGSDVYCLIQLTLVVMVLTSVQYAHLRKGFDLYCSTNLDPMWNQTHDLLHTNYLAHNKSSLL